MRYPDEAVRASVVYILVQLCVRKDDAVLALPLVHTMCRSLSVSLATSQSHDLTINLMGLVRALLKNPVYARCLLQADTNTEAKGSTFASAFKRVLLSRDEVLQLSGVQCVAEVLIHHSHYTQALLRADIAEFLFEALSSDNQTLVSAVLQCLSSMATVEDFYTGCHAVYGFDSIAKAVSVAIVVKNNKATSTGFNLLGLFLSRGRPVLSTDSLHHLMKTVRTALEDSDLDTIIGASSTLAEIIKSHYIPSSYPLTSLLPLLALLLHHTEITAATSSTATPSGHTHTPHADHTHRLLSRVLNAFNNMCQLCEERFSGDGGQCGQVYHELATFLLHSCDDVLTPLVLATSTSSLNDLPSCDLFASLLTIWTALFNIISSEISGPYHHTVKLVQSGFIPLTFEMRALNSQSNDHQSLMGSAGVVFIEELVYHLMIRDPHDRSSADHIRATLHSALPLIKCTLTSAHGYLAQRVDLYHSSSQLSSSTLLIQSTILALCYISLRHNTEISMDSESLLHSLSSFISLNPDIHQLPITMIKHLLLVYTTVCSMQQASVSRRQNVDSLLVRGVMRLSDHDIAAVFTASQPLLHWAYTHEPLRNKVANNWLLQWMVCMSDSTKLLRELVELVQVCPPLLADIEALLITEDKERSEQVLCVLESLAEQDVWVKRIQAMTVKCLLQRRVDPLSDVSCGAVLKLLVKFPITGEADPKLIIQVTNIIVRSSVSTPEGIMATYCGLQVLHQLTNQPGSSQVADLLLNNKPLLNKLTSFITMESVAGGRQCVAVSLELVGSLVERYQHSLSDCYTESITLCYDVLLRTLTSTNPHIIGAGLVLWRAVTSEKRKPSCLKIVHKIAGKEKESIRQLAFLLINIIAKEDELLTSKAIDVYINLHVNHPLDGSSHSWIKQLIQFLCWRHNQQELPMQYQPLINAV